MKTEPFFFLISAKRRLKRNFYHILSLFLQEKHMLHSSQHFSAGKTGMKNTERCEIGEEMENMIKGDKFEKSFRKTQFPSKF